MVAGIWVVDSVVVFAVVVVASVDDIVVEAAAVVVASVDAVVGASVEVVVGAAVVELRAFRSIWRPFLPHG